MKRAEIEPDVDVSLYSVNGSENKTRGNGTDVPFLKGIQIVKDIRENKVEQRPQLCEVILPKSMRVTPRLQKGTHVKWRAGQDHASSARVFFDLLHESAIEVLQPMALVDDDIAPIVL